MREGQLYNDPLLFLNAKGNVTERGCKRWIYARIAQTIEPEEVVHLEDALFLARGREVSQTESEAIERAVKSVVCEMLRRSGTTGSEEKRG